MNVTRPAARAFHVLGGREYPTGEVLNAGIRP